MDSTKPIPYPEPRGLAKVRAMVEDESGVTAIEYGLLAGLIVVVAVGTISATGTSIGLVYTTWSAAVVAAL